MSTHTLTRQAHTSPSTPSISYSKRIADLVPSPIREILAVIDRPGMISFAGGLPAVESFPHFSLDSMPQTTLQYGESEGERDLRRLIAESLQQRGLPCKAEQVLVVSGSQQGIDLTAKLLIDPGTAVAVESPTYLAALQVFRFFGARFIPFHASAPDTAILAQEAPALVYAIPTFQNPSGHCMTLSERTALAETCDKLNLPLFEDDPYYDLAFDLCERRPVCSFLKHTPWIYQGSFSKSLAPGVRLGYLAASPELVPLLTRLKQATDLHSNRIGQFLVQQQLQNPEHPANMQKLAARYHIRRDAFEAALQRHFKDLATWQKPAGGLFFWLRLNKHNIDTRQLLPKAIEAGVAFMPGEPFFPLSTEACGQLRLNFSHASETQADEGLCKLATLIREAI